MQLSEILVPGAVRVLPKVSSKKRLFCDLAEIAHDVHGLPQADALTALQDREALGPTGVGDGIALPHARLEDLSHVHGVFLRLEQPLDFDAMDRKPVDLVFGLFAPVGAGVTHLKALALVSRTLRDPGLCAKLRANTDPSLLYTVLTEAQASQAA
ncbi:PTS sugar transporter subunit IIA [Jannaschia seohaensis]|uniref:PTS system nitrogen regulatory IIA component n=1 Tax=Jannaschia seohaensis TaxID=475081 RepID=A0A2Y9A638_9RHOB|nr:PTS sugar transporter subunit IIA [Jannaschia seohaensis]PWJ21781.1 PTS system nitrogen regulatory IIA component [Jannaschia seohaensis]SSA38059.1 PTS system, nitrogen regulatory IIA component [Jannaschia seohaensis]